jgi:hypothetical protein
MLLIQKRASSGMTHYFSNNDWPPLILPLSIVLHFERERERDMKHSDFDHLWVSHAFQLLMKQLSFVAVLDGSPQESG